MAAIMIRPMRERRLGEVLADALRIACEQQEIDLARQLEQLLAAHARRQSPPEGERRGRLHQLAAKPCSANARSG